MAKTSARISTVNRVPVYVQIPKATAKRLHGLGRRYKLPQWAVVEMGINLVKGAK